MNKLDAFDVKKYTSATNARRAIGKMKRIRGTTRVAMLKQVDAHFAVETIAEKTAADQLEMGSSAYKAIRAIADHHGVSVQMLCNDVMRIDQLLGHLKP